MRAVTTDDGAARQSVTGRAFLIVMIDGYDTLMISFLAPLLARQYGLRPVDIGGIFASGYAGAIVGAAIMGPLADRLGRKAMLLAALLLTAAATAACAAAGSLATLLALRFVAGIGLGGAVPAVIALTAEHARPGRRNGTVTLMYIGFPLGAVIGGAVTAALLDAGTQAIFLGAALVSLGAAMVAATLPGGGKVRRAGPGGNLFLEQFAEGRLAPALALWVAGFSTLVLTYFLLSWTPSIIVAMGGSARDGALAPIVLNLGGIVGALVLAPLIDRFGPYRPSALLALAGAALVVAVGQVATVLPLMLVTLFVTGFCVVGAQLNFPAMSAALFPAGVRSAGSGWAFGFSRLGSIAGPLLGGALAAAHLTNPRLFLLAAIPAGVTAAMLLFVGQLRRGSLRGSSQPVA